MKENPPLSAGLVSLLVSVGLILFVLIYYPTGDERSWGGMGFLAISAFFGVTGLILTIIGIWYRYKMKRS
ncbi:hypothetical protein [Bacillus sp. Marseille-P3800]|uniref:hypothetical protein n=1 Tax=Bacillus sp. Marseille-P3800 TaxID=2014782 RepID=UPI000C07705F|nr:hypothetical protein [Bacillus sp. Marseille-P3800]